MITLKQMTFATNAMIAMNPCTLVFGATLVRSIVVKENASRDSKPSTLE